MTRRKIVGLAAIILLLLIALLVVPRQDCSYFYGTIGERIGGAVTIAGCEKLGWPQYVLDKIR